MNSGKFSSFSLTVITNLVSVFFAISLISSKKSFISKIGFAEHSVRTVDIKSFDIVVACKQTFYKTDKRLLRSRVRRLF